MARIRRPEDDVRELRWADMMRTLRVFGHVKDFSKPECLKMAAALKKEVDAGRIMRVKRGRYRVPW